MKRIFISALGVALIPLAGMGQCPAERDTLPKIDNSKYILTPPAPATPRINGAKVFGARPGSNSCIVCPVRVNVR